jgi:energy-converting hydrogenase B subunit D
VILASIAPVQAVTLILAALAATAVALCMNPLRQIVLSGIYGLILTLTFMTLQAPDVALSMLVVTTVAYPLIVLAAIGRTKRKAKERK